MYEFAYVLHHREELDTELRSYKSLLAQIDAAEQTLQKTSEQKVHRAVEELAAKVGQEDVRIFYFLQYSMGINLCSYVVACIINNAWLYGCKGSPLHCSCYEKSVYSTYAGLACTAVYVFVELCSLMSFMARSE